MGLNCLNHPTPRQVGRVLTVCLLLAAGCRTPAAPYAAESEEKACSIGWVLTRQLVADTCLEAVHHPLRCTWNNCCELKDHLAAAADGVLAKRCFLNLCGAPGPLAPCPAPADGGPAPDPGLQPACVQLFCTGEDSLHALEDLVARATCRIDVLMFYWENDPLGEEVAAVLAARAGPHLRVRVLVDGGGNLLFGKQHRETGRVINHVVAKLARQPYVEVIRIRNPCARFDHRKLVLVDGKAAWTGGRNFAHSAFFKHHDVSFTLTGPLVDELQKTYDAYWCDQGGPANPPPAPPGEAAAPAPPAPPAVPLPCPPACVNAYARLLCTEPGCHEIGRSLYQAIDGACHHVYVENLYFSDSRLVCKLAAARRRGVDVRAVITFTTGSDNVDGANKVVANRLLKAGVRVYVYPIMTHVKAAAVDGRWVYLGTGNFDALSLRHNHELGLAVGAGPLIGEVEERLFLTDFQPDWELTAPVPVTFWDYLSEMLACLAL